MILVVNTYITDRPLNSIHGEGSQWEAIRCANTTFRKQSKLDIFKFTVDSYRFLDFDRQYFFVECEDPSQHKEINNHILSVFPKAFINNKRCATFDEYQMMIKHIGPLNDWIFYSPNNDHVFWSSKDINKSLRSVLSEAARIGANHDNKVGVFYSHLEEFVSLPYKDNWFGQCWNNEHEPRHIIEDNEDYVAFTSDKGENTSIQILHPELFKTFFASLDFGDCQVRRIEDLKSKILVQDQVSIVPKFLICAHFDGQPSLDPRILPPLFIPSGYFQDSIPLKVNCDQYDSSLLNISSTFRLPPYLDPHRGTDFIGGVDDLPLVIAKKI
jgi:hypothetical protein|tara:strand:+ start:3109 stop:4089 length:981 start_codon:yes stop_codon:yes gene_type:complete